LISVKLAASRPGLSRASLIHVNGAGKTKPHRRKMSGADQHWVILDGAHGEGGGQILRTALSLSAISGRPFRIDRIRALRRKPGLAAQHLTAVHSAAALCAAQLSGGTLGSTSLAFVPTMPVAAGDYVFDVGLAREGGSAGAVMLVLQTVLLPLARAAAASRVLLRGGTHMAWSPPFDYVRDVWLPMLARLGVCASVNLRSWGWYPVGKGEVITEIEPRPADLKAVEIDAPGPLLRVRGRAVAANLPAHIPQRMAERARTLLAEIGAETEIEPLQVRAACAGAGIFLTAEYANLNCGFNALGAPGKPSEQVAEEGATALLKHHASGAALDRHLGDQILLPLCLAGGPSHFSVEAITRHLETNAWVIERFGMARIVAEWAGSGIGKVTVTPSGMRQPIRDGVGPLPVSRRYPERCA
jgi:RNA 3'-terminal phosphate cyclase (ATP)